ncbi:MAG: GNAT family N-acetyltransferase [Planctomycetes bacterium]|nr:GNAT family N-acetyltransferase [Planctomycetota bacterium]
MDDHLPTGTTSHGLAVTEETTWTAEESRVFGDLRLDNAGVYARHSTARTKLTLVKVRRGGELVGVAPALRMIQYRATRLLEPRSRRWMDPLMGPFARRTTCLVDGSFLAFRHAAPFFAAGGVSAGEVREAVVGHLKGCRDVESLMISEPAGDPGWALDNGFLAFLQLPLVRVELDGVASFDEHLAALGQKRRRNLRKERELFAQEGGTMEVHAPPLAPELVEELHRLLLASSANNPTLEIPFEDLMNSRGAFGEQAQWVIVARVGGAVAGFFGFLPQGETLAQCHGGLDYEHSLRVKAYPNLIHEAVAYALEHGFREVTLGPLNNEAKRRAGTLAPVMASFWARDPLTMWLTKRVLLPRFQVFGGRLERAGSA